MEQTKEEIRNEFYQYIGDNFTAKPGVVSQHKKLKDFFVRHDAAETKKESHSKALKGALLQRLENSMARGKAGPQNEATKNQMLVLKSIHKFIQDFEA